MTTIQSSPSPTATKIPVGGGDDDDGKTPIGPIVVGVVVPVVLILIALFIGYRCYRRRFPVRMTMGRNFGKFSNPAYSRPKSAATLVREAQGNGEDGGGVLNSQMQPSLVHGGPVSFLPGTTPGEGSRVMYVNEGYTPDSGDVDEESEADRRFRLAKAYLFKYEEDSDDAGNNNDKRNNKKKTDGKQRGDKDNTKRREDEVDSYSEMSEDFDDAGRTPPARKKGKRAANGAAMKGQDNPAFSGDNEEEAEKSSAGMSSSEDDLDKEQDDPKAPAKPRRKRKQEKSPDAVAAAEAEKRDSEYNSSMTVEDYMRTVATERERATGRSEGSAHESAGETDRETSSEQEEDEHSTPGKSPFVRPPNEKVKGITVGEFMRLAKEKQRSNSDVVRARADSLSQTYDVTRMSARRRAQSVDAMASPRRQPDKTGVTRSESASYTSPPIASRSLRDSRDNLQTSLEDLSQIPHDEDSDSRMEVLEEKQDTEGLVEKTERTVVTFTNDSEHDSDKSSRSSSPMAAEHHPGDVDENGSDAEPAENDLYENAIVLANKQLIPRDMNQTKYAQGGSPSEEHDKDGKRTGDEKDKDEDDELYENTASSNKKDNEVDDDDDDDELYENIAVSAPPVSVSITSSAATPERRRSSGSPNPAIHVSKTSSGESSGEDDVDSSIEPSLRGEASPPRRLKIVENTAPTPSRLLTPPPVDTEDRVKYIDFARSGSVGSAEGDSMQGSFVVIAPSSEVPNKDVDDDDLSIASVKSGSTSSASVVGLEEEHRGSAQNDPRDGDSPSGGEEAEPELRHADTGGAPTSPNRSPQTDLRKIQAGSSKLLKGLTHSDASSASSVSLADDSGDEHDDEKPRPDVTKQPRRVQFVAGLKQEHTTDEEIDESDTDQEEEPEQQIAVSKSSTPALVTTAILTSPPMSSSSAPQPHGSGLAAVTAVPPTPQPSKTSSPPTTSQSLFGAEPPASQMTKVSPPTTSQSLFGRLRGLAGLRQHPAAVAGDTASSSRPGGASPAKTPEDVARSESPPPLRGKEALKQLGQQFREQGSGNKAPPTTAPTPDSTTSKDHVSSATSQASAAATPPASPAKRESRNDSDSDEIRFTDDDIDDALASDDDDDASSLEDLKPSVASPSQQKQSQGAGKVMLKVDTPTFTFGDPDDDDADDDDSDDDRGGHSGTYVFGKHADDDDDIDV